jgi:hypothetical protein
MRTSSVLPSSTCISSSAIGGIVGGTVGGLVVFTIVLCLWLRRRSIEPRLSARPSMETTPIGSARDDGQNHANRATLRYPENDEIGGRLSS